VTPSPTPTETPIPQPSLETFLNKDTQTALTQQGWKIDWDKNKAQYTISQLAWDEANKTFTSQTTHEIGFIDAEGRLHFTATYYSATENPDGTWKDTSTTQNIVVDLKSLPQNPNLTIRQTDENGKPIDFAQVKKELAKPGFHTLETKNPAFKNGILVFTALDEQGQPVSYTFDEKTYQVSEFSKDLVHPTPVSIDHIHSLAALKWLLLQYGDGQPFPTKGPIGWSIQFQYSPENNTKYAFLRLRNGEPSQYIRIGKEKNLLNIPWLEIILPDGTAYPSTPVELFNPQDPQNPTDGNEKLILFPVFLGKMTQDQRQLFSDVYLSHPERFATLFNDPNIDLAQEGGYYSKLGTNSYYDPTPLDSLLGMENIMGENGLSYFPAIYNNVIYGNGPSEPPLSEELPLIEWDLKGTPLPKELQGKVFPISR
jgi:hypothetical protein